MYILHGENTPKSRQRLTELLSQNSTTDQDSIRLPAKRLTPAQLEVALGGDGLFGSRPIVVVEELHSLPTSGRKKDLIALLSKYAQNSNSETHDLILWEKRSLTATMLKKFAGARNEEFKASKVLFRWLDSLNGKPASSASLKLFHQALDEENDVFVFTMLCRQIRLLIQVTDSGTADGPPFLVGKLKKQASSFNLPQLLKIHRKLLLIDQDFKTSGSLLNLGQELDLLMLKWNK